MVLGGKVNKHMKTFSIYALLTLINFVINFGIYNYSFNKQATLYLHESQKLESGILMLKTTLPAYIVAAILITLIFIMVAKYTSHSK